MPVGIAAAQTRNADFASALVLDRAKMAMPSLALVFAAGPYSRREGFSEASRLC